MRQCILQLSTLVACKRHCGGIGGAGPSKILDTEKPCSPHKGRNMGHTVMLVIEPFIYPKHGPTILSTDVGFFGTA